MAPRLVALTKPCTGPTDGDRVTAWWIAEAVGCVMGERLGRMSIPPAVVAILAVAAVLVAAGGGYLLGHSSGEDLDAARASGEQAGAAAGKAKGALRGE